jgi:hypothetical protein
VNALADLETIASELLLADTEAKRLREQMYALIRKLYDEGERPIVIANAAGVTRMRINQIVNAKVAVDA